MHGQTLPLQDPKRTADGRQTPNYQGSGKLELTGESWGVTQTNPNGVVHTHGENERTYLGNRLWSRFEVGFKGTDSGWTILIASINVSLGRAGVLEASL